MKKGIYERTRAVDPDRAAQAMSLASSPAAALVAEQKSSRSRNLYHFVRGMEADNFIHFFEDEVGTGDGCLHILHSRHGAAVRHERCPPATPPSLRKAHHRQPLPSLPPAPPLPPLDRQVRIYEALFRVHLLDDEDTVSADREGRRFIRRSGLPDNLLDAILDAACGGTGGGGGRGGNGGGNGGNGNGAALDGGEDDGGDGGYDFRGRYISREGWFVMCKLVALHQYYQRHPQHAPSGMPGGATALVSAEELFHYQTGNSPDHEDSRGRSGHAPELSC